MSGCEAAVVGKTPGSFSAYSRQCVVGNGTIPRPCQAFDRIFESDFRIRVWGSCTLVRMAPAYRSRNNTTVIPSENTRNNYLRAHVLSSAYQYMPPSEHRQPTWGRAIVDRIWAIFILIYNT